MGVARLPDVPDSSVPQDRRAARVLLVDAADRVLLLHGSDPTTPERGQWWITPGGGLEPGEAPAAAAARELREETGLDVDAAALGEPVHARTTEFHFLGHHVLQSEDYFLLRVQAHDVATDTPDPGITGHRWWPLAELPGTAEQVVPAELHDLLTGLLA